jgi:uncharacterized protein YeaO (DUF488 family)
LTIKTKSIYEEKKKSDGTRVLISRFYPRGVKRTHFDVWIREASPEAPLLKEYKNKVISWREFSKRFREQMRSSPNSQKAIQDLIELSERRNVTLLCYEKEGQKCHRDIVKAVTERAIRLRHRPALAAPK